MLVGVSQFQRSYLQVTSSHMSAAGAKKSQAKLDEDQTQFILPPTKEACRLNIFEHRIKQVVVLCSALEPA